MTIKAGSTLTIGEDSYSIRKRIGHGGQASVWLAVREPGQQPGQQPVAIKAFEIKDVTLRGSDERRNTRDLVQREIGALSKSSSIHTPKYYGRVFHDENDIVVDDKSTKAKYAYIAMEYVEGCSLQQYLDDYFSINNIDHPLNNHNGLPFDQLKPLAAMMVVHLEHLHAQGIAHRDFKPSNLFLTREGTLKTGDFGFSITAPDNGRAHTPVPCAESRAPELIRVSNGGYESEKVDIWQLGVTLAYMLQARLPFSATKYSSIEDMITKDTPQLPNIYPQTDTNTRNLIDLIRKCLDKSPAGRPSLEEIKAHKFFEGIDWEAASKGELRAPIKADLLPAPRSHTDSHPSSYGSEISDTEALFTDCDASSESSDKPNKERTVEASAAATHDEPKTHQSHTKSQQATKSNARLTAAASTLFTTSAVGAGFSEIEFHALSKGLPSLAESFIHSITAMSIAALLLALILAICLAIFNSPSKNDTVTDYSPPAPPAAAA